MKAHQTPSALAVLAEGAEGLLDIFEIGATSMEDHASEADTLNLRYDVEQIGGDFRRVMSYLESGSFSE